MKLLNKYIERDLSGSVKLQIEEEEDLWHCYNLLAEGDKITSSTIRKIQKETTTGSVSSERQRLTISLQISKIQYDGDSSQIRVSGSSCQENRFVKIGSYHTIDLEVNKEFKLFKQEWDSVALELLNTSTDIAHRADVVALVMNEGLAHLCYITSSMTVQKSRIEVPVPRKGRSTSDAHHKALESFFSSVLQSIHRNVNFSLVKCFIIASPAFVKDKFYQYMIEQANKNDIYKEIAKHKSKFILAHSSSGHRYSIKEILSDPAIISQLSNTKAASEVKALNDFYDTLKKNPNRAFYGFDHVNKANEKLAIETLLVTDDLFRGKNTQTRKKYVDLVESVRANKGEAKIFSGKHVSGEQLAKLSGVAAILRYPLELEDEEDEYIEDDDEESDNESDNDEKRENRDENYDDLISDSSDDEEGYTSLSNK